jgi:hypothetical protein
MDEKMKMLLELEERRLATRKQHFLKKCELQVMQLEMEAKMDEEFFDQQARLLEASKGNGVKGARRSNSPSLPKSIGVTGSGVAKVLKTFVKQASKRVRRVRRR